MSTECEISELIAALVVACQPEFVLEIGAHYGQTTANIAKAIQRNGHGEFVSLEIDLGLFESASHRCQGLDVEIIHTDSLQYIPPKPVDFIFVDGGNARDKDVEHFLPYLSPRAMVIIHDLGNDEFMPQWGHLIELLGNQYITLDNPRGLAIFKLGSKRYGNL